MSLAFLFALWHAYLSQAGRRPADGPQCTRGGSVVAARREPPVTGHGRIPPHPTRLRVTPPKVAFSGRYLATTGEDCTESYPRRSHWIAGRRRSIPGTDRRWGLTRRVCGLNWRPVIAWIVVAAIWIGIQPLVSLAREAAVVAVASVLKPAASSPLLEWPVRRLITDPIYASVAIDMIGNIDAHGLALAGPVGRGFEVFGRRFDRSGL